VAHRKVHTSLAESVDTNLLQSTCYELHFNFNLRFIGDIDPVDDAFNFGTLLDIGTAAVLFNIGQKYC
jgi:hypothetical protein